MGGALPVVLLCLLVAIFSITPISGACKGTDCGSCVASSNSSANLHCGWCADVVGGIGSFCANGTSAGPASPLICQTDLQEWQFTACPDPCQNQGLCTDCALGFPGCGWCMSTNACFSSAKAANCPGPASNFRNNASVPNPCGSAITCDQVFNCNDCMTNTYQTCTWCNATRTCLAAVNSTVCGRSFGFTNINQCPTFNIPAAASVLSSFLAEMVKALLLLF